MNLPTLVETSRALRRGETSATTLVRAALEQADRFRHLNVLAFLDVDCALAEARARDEEARQGRWRGPLHGLPLTVKDLFNVRGMPTRAGTSAPLPPIIPDEAPAVTRLREAGAIILAKTHMHEIALGLTGENPWTGDVRNPHDPARQAGGSSSGSAVAVAVGIGFASLGSDTAGSIRVPAAYCGVVGFKPSYGRISLDGALPLVPSCDHAGPLARTVEDAALVFDVLAGAHTLDALEVLSSPPRLAVPSAYLAGRLTTAMRCAFTALLDALRQQGAQVQEVELAIGDVAQQFAPLRAESVMVHRHVLESQPEAFSEPVRAALLRGYEFSAVQYLAARQAQAEVRRALHAAMVEADALLMPAAPGVAPLLGTREIALESGLCELRAAIVSLSLPAAFAGLPAVSVPFARWQGMPLGVQVIAPFGADDVALRCAAWIERYVPALRL